MKILVIGDPHGDLQGIRKINLNGLDLILLTGDLGSANLMRKMHFENVTRTQQGLPEIEHSSREKKRAFMEAYDSTMKLIKYLSSFHAEIFTVFGNVENSNAETRKISKEIGLHLPFLYDELRKRNVRVLNNVIANFHGVRIGGVEYFVDSNWVREFKPSDYREQLASARVQTMKAKRVLKNFGDVDILLCHQPPYGILDGVNFKGAPKHWRGKHAGSPVILDYIKRNQPQYVFCGHIPEGEGMKKVGRTEVYNLGVGGFKFIEL